MNDVINKSLAAKLLALSTLALMACPTVKGNDGGTGGGTGNQDECTEAADCVALKGGTLSEWYCNAATALCEPACRTNENCNPGTRLSAALDQCATGLHCVCDEGKCIGSLCSDDSQCSTDGSSVCRSGACVTPPAAATVTRCEVVPDFAVLAAGAKQTFHVSAWAGTDPVVITEGATWTANGGGTVPASATGNKVEFTAGSATFASGDAVTATFGSVTCKAQAIVITAPAAGNTIVVIDELSGRPVEGASIVVTDSAGALAGGAAVTTTADGHGDVTLAANQTVTVFHKDYSYLSIVNAAPTTKLIAAVVRRNQVDKFGGFKGGITNLPTDNTIKAAIAGMSVAGNITNLNITQLLGPSVTTDIALSDSLKVDDIPLPSGIFLYFNKVLTGRGTPPDGKVVGMGLAGTCGDATAEKNGTCGTRSAWALTGAIELTKLVNLAGSITGGFDLSQIGSLLGNVVPLLKGFKSSLVRDVQFSLSDTTWTNGEADFSDVSGANFTTQDIEFGQLPLGFSFPVKMPPLPKFGGQYIDAVAVLGGANAVGRGVVPLGLGVGVNTKDPKDAVVDAIGTDGKDGYVPEGYVGLRMAPNHHGIEGSDYGLLVLGISAAAITDPAAGIGISAIFPRVDKLEFATEVDISGNAFPAFPEGAAFNYSPTATAGRSFSVGKIDNTGIIRVSFSGEKERRWDVLVASGTTGATFKLPTLAVAFGGEANIPAGLTDRLYTNPGATLPVRAAMTVQAFRLTVDGRGGAPVSFSDYTDLSTGIQTDTTHFLTGFSLQAFTPPSSSLTFSPAPTMMTPSPTPTGLSIKVSGVSIATGKNKVKLTPPAGCTTVPDAAAAQSETTAGKNTVEFTLAGTCKGAFSSEIVANDGSSLDPAVISTGTPP